MVHSIKIRAMIQPVLARLLTSVSETYHIGID